MSLSAIVLQKMLNLRYEFSQPNNITFYPIKCYCVRVGKMPAFMSKVHADGIYRRLPAFTDIAGFCYCFLLLAQK